MKPSLKKPLVIATLIILPTAALSGIAMADQRADKRAQIIKRLDTNGDGKLSIAETVTRASMRFERADQNKDGAITVEEITATMQRRRSERFARRVMRRLDVNGDGKVTKEEMESRARKRFARMDADDSGFLEQDEMRRSRWRRGSN
ncbi:MAG: EF-hand domain-containing protein [Pseudomonadota bacterium]